MQVGREKRRGTLSLGSTAPPGCSQDRELPSAPPGPSAPFQLHWARPRTSCTGDGIQAGTSQACRCQSQSRAASIRPSYRAVPAAPTLGNGALVSPEEAPMCAGIALQVFTPDFSSDLQQPSAHTVAQLPSFPGKMMSPSPGPAQPVP